VVLERVGVRALVLGAGQRWSGGSTDGPFGGEGFSVSAAGARPCAGNWRPLFLDYLYVSFTNATAFSPTDTLPLSRWAKMLMLLEAAASLVLALLVAARAINILK
jgi:hypothetical protein